MDTRFRFELGGYSAPSPSAVFLPASSRASSARRSKDGRRQTAVRGSQAKGSISIVKRQGEDKSYGLFDRHFGNELPHLVSFGNSLSF
jgi:hypothetical protein